MKKLSLLTAVLLISLSGIYAQQNKLEVIHRLDKDVPMVVLAAIEKGYPGLNIHQHLIAPAPEPKLKKEKKTRNISREPSKAYNVLYNGENYMKREVYSKEGKLLYSRERMTNIAMPRAVYNYIGKEYNGWLIKRNVASRKIQTRSNAIKHLTSYKILLRNGKQKKWITLDEYGKVYSRKRF